MVAPLSEIELADPHGKLLAHQQIRLQQVAVDL